MAKMRRFMTQAASALALAVGAVFPAAPALALPGVLDPARAQAVPMMPMGVAVSSLPYAPGMPITKAVLPNGLTVFVLQVPGSPVVTSHLWVRAGSRDEKPGTTGIAHLFEHMMFRPVKEGAPSYFDQASMLGLRFNASTRFNATDYWATYPPDQLRQVLQMEAGRFKHLVVSEEMLKLEREAVRSEYQTKFDNNPVIDLWFQVYRMAFPGHPYGWHIVGERADLDRITAEDCNRFFQANYTPGNSALVVAGPQDPGVVVEAVTWAFSGWAPGLPKATWKRQPPLGQREVLGAGKLPSATRYLLVGYRVPDRDAPDRLAQDLAHYLLFNAKTSLVSRRLVDELRLASTADAFNTFYDIGLSKLLVVPNAGVDQARILKEVDAAIAGFASYPEADFVAQRRAYATYLREHQLKTQEATAAIGMAWAYDGNAAFAGGDPAAVLRIPRAEIARILRTQYAPTNRVVVASPVAQ